LYVQYVVLFEVEKGAIEYIGALEVQFIEGPLLIGFPYHDHLVAIGVIGKIARHAQGIEYGDPGVG
jgi:hypothetical protein